MGSGTVLARTAVESAQGQTTARTAPTALKIVVIEGEDAVNVIQQRTAVSPIVEVRDRNDQPVSGAVVTFAIRSGRATFGGARSLTVSTNAAGRATASGLTPTGGGSLQIGATASFQGQTAVATIVQTNVLTSAAGAAGAGVAAAGAGAGGGTGAGAAASGAAGGGGLSATTLVVSGAAAVGGGLAAAKALGGDGCTNCGPGTGIYTGTASYSFVETHNSSGLTTAPGNVNGTCTFTVSVALAMRADLSANDSGVVVTGHFETTRSETLVAQSCQGTVRPNSTVGPQIDTVDGQPLSALRYQRSDSGVPATIGGNQTYTTSFSGAAAGTTITGTFTYAMQLSSIQAGVQASTPATSTFITLTRQ
ncbi:MAG: hypothetical protein U0Q55_16380 [Vicinamibacterales bacterium]